MEHNITMSLKDEAQKQLWAEMLDSLKSTTQEGPFVEESPSLNSCPVEKENNKHEKENPLH